MPSFRSVAPLSLGLFLALSGCNKKGDASNSPGGMSEEEVEAKKKEAQAAAKVNTLILQANEALSAGRYVTARKIAEDALAENAENANAYVVLGAAAWRAGDFNASTEALRKALELDPSNYGGGIALARNLRAASQYEEALAVLEPVIATESVDFKEKSCEELEDCEDVAGWCDTTAKVCKPPVLVDTRVGQLWTYYMTLDTAAGPAVAEEVFLSGAQAADMTIEAIRGYADFLRAFADKGELATIEGDKGSSTLGLDVNSGFVHSFAVVGGEPSLALFSPIQVESRIHRELADSLGLESLGKVKLFNVGEYDVTLLPEVEFKGLKIKNVPVLIDDLSMFSAMLPETAGVLLGHQVLDKIGAIEADIPGQSLTVYKDAPSAAPAGAAELPLIMLDQWFLHVPAAEISIDGSEHNFWAWFGYSGASSVNLTEKAYLKSGHLPREIENPEDVDYGRKMVYVDSVDFGESSTPSMGGIVYLEQPGEPMVDQVRGFAGFELGGMVNAPLMESLKITWMYGAGKVWIELPKAAE